MSAFVYMLICADGSFYVGNATGDAPSVSLSIKRELIPDTLPRGVLFSWFGPSPSGVLPMRSRSSANSKGSSRARKEPLLKCDWSEIEQLSKRRGGRPLFEYGRPDATGGGSNP